MTRTRYGTRPGDYFVDSVNRVQRNTACPGFFTRNASQPCLDLQDSAEQPSDVATSDASGGFDLWGPEQTPTYRGPLYLRDANGRFKLLEPVDMVDRVALLEEDLAGAVGAEIAVQVPGALAAAGAVTQADVDAAIATLVAAAPELLNTLDELADALGDDPNYAATLTAALAAKADTAALTAAVEASEQAAMGTYALLDAGLLKVNGVAVPETALPATLARDTEVTAAVAAAVTAVAARLGMRNRIINGDFRINQQAYVSGTAAAVGVYTFDQWKSTLAATSLTFVAAPAGQLVTVNSGGQVAQPIERANMPAGRYVVSHGGTAQVRCYNVGASPPAFAACPIVVDLDGLADVVVEFLANGATKTVGLVQCEQVGATGTVADATPFERRPIGAELALCQRYLWRSTGNSTAINTQFASGKCVDATDAVFWIPYPVTMRATPTFAWSGLRTTDTITANFAPTNFAIVAGSTNEGAAVIRSSGATGQTARNAVELQSNTAAGYIQFSARL